MTKKKIERKHWILAGITLANASRSLLSRADILVQVDLKGDAQRSKKLSLGAPEGFGITPMVLALSMEIALKAWVVFDKNDSTLIRGHNLAELFLQLSPRSKEKLEKRFKCDVASQFPNVFKSDHSLAALLEQHKNAFQEWRYFYEIDHLNMNIGEFKAAVEMILDEFDKRHYTDDRTPLTL